MRYFPMQFFAAGPILPYSASCGCYWNPCCAFCPEKAEGALSAGSAVSGGPPARSLCSGRHRRSFILPGQRDKSGPFEQTHRKPLRARPWYGFARVTRRLADKKFAGRWTGRLVVYGRIRHRIRRSRRYRLRVRRDRPPRCVEGARLAQEGGIMRTYVYLLFGTPWESIDEAQRSTRLTVRHSRVINLLNLAILNMQ